MSEQKLAWSLLRELLVAVSEDLGESLEADPSAALQPMRARLLLRNIDAFLAESSIATTRPPDISTVTKTPAETARKEIDEFVAVIDNNVVN